MESGERVRKKSKQCEAVMELITFTTKILYIILSSP